MMNYLKTLNHKLLTLFLTVGALLFFVSVVVAQSPTTSSGLTPTASTAQITSTQTDAAKKYNITFPIAELGNCANIGECRIFCEDPVNSTACIDFAKKKGFYKENKISTEKDELLEKAIAELGCTSPESCREFCHEEANFDKCNEFAKKNNLNGGHIEDPAKQEVLTAAKEALGCTSYESCKAFCLDSANEKKCSEFAHKTGLRGGEKKTGPGGCTSEETCKKFCSAPENFELCAHFNTAQGAGTFVGPGGCTSEATCKTYCQEHQTECSNFRKPGTENNEGFNRQEMCLKTPSCTWQESNCECKSFAGISTENGEGVEQFCTDNADKCENGKPKVRPEEYCQRYPDRCRGGIDPKEMCAKRPQCTWSTDSNVCQCDFKEPERGATQQFGTPSGNFNEEQRKLFEQTKPPLTPGANSDTRIRPSGAPFPSGTGPRPSGTFSPPGLNNSESMCIKNPNCKWSDNRCSCQPGTAATGNISPAINRDVFCKEHPDQCASLQPPQSNLTQPPQGSTDGANPFGNPEVTKPPEQPPATDVQGVATRKNLMEAFFSLILQALK